MNIHEYQAKQLFERFNVATPKGRPAETPQEAEKVAAGLNTANLVVKAQIHSGGRGKGIFTNGFKGGVKLCATPAEARELANKMLGQTLVTHQTGPAGKVVQKVLVAESVDIAREIYFAILMDRATGTPVVVASTEGGVEIETVAEEHPEKIIREPVHPLLGLQPFQTLKLGRQLSFQGDQLKAASKLFANLYRLFESLDCSLVEINPLVVTKKGEVFALDAKFNFDDNALYRHKEIVELRDVHEEDPREVEASKFCLNYIGLEGNIACLDSVL
jgi:succinyl-CoA synthetase beta subunit